MNESGVKHKTCSEMCFLKNFLRHFSHLANVPSGAKSRSQNEAKQNFASLLFFDRHTRRMRNVSIKRPQSQVLIVSRIDLKCCRFTMRNGWHSFNQLPWLLH